MFILGLTGSIGMGKTETAKMFRQRLVPVFDADAVARRITAPGGAILADIARAFPETVVGSRLDRAKLSEIVFADAERRRLLESLVHPLVQGAERQFLRAARRKRNDVVVLDIPLLFETDADQRCGASCVVTAPRAVQMERVLKRESMTPALFEKIEKTQMPDQEKRQRADYIIDTGSSLGETRTSVYRLLHRLRHRARSEQRRAWLFKPAGEQGPLWSGQ